MPTYEYRCTACDHEFELFQSMTDPVKRKCPKCGKPKLERLIGTGAGIIFKGGGFYQTDYRSESYKKAAEAEKTSAAPATESAGAKSDAGGGNSSSAEHKSSEKSSKLPAASKRKPKRK